ncbi:MAG TPA: hypothetical protein VFP65_14125 [Anaeromyxobacteraceae bacterium]|nr:hypothetical protein [Anaeromyxobacteraceae bacterium]
MTKTHLGLLAGLLLLAAACGGRSGAASTAQPESLPGRGAIRLLGVGPSDLDSILLDVESVELSCDGNALASTRDAGPFELTRHDNAWLLALFDMPAQGTIHVKIKLAGSGRWAAKGAYGAIDARGDAIEFDAPVGWFDRERHAVVQLDLARSLLDGCAGTKLLVPQLKIVN